MRDGGPGWGLLSLPSVSLRTTEHISELSCKLSELPLSTTSQYGVLKHNVGTQSKRLFSDFMLEDTVLAAVRYDYGAQLCSTFSF